MESNRVFYIALLISLVFHLSMVTVFSIQIPFFRPVITYHQFDVVNPRTLEPMFRPRSVTLQMPNIEEMLRAQAFRDGGDGPLRNPFLARGAAAALDGGRPDPFAALPQVTLPQLDVADLSQIDIAALSSPEVETGFLRRSEAALNLDEQVAALRESIASRRRIDEPLPEVPPLEELPAPGEALEPRAPSERLGDGPGQSLAEAPSIPNGALSSQPALGYSATVEWLTRPTGRALLFAPPIPALAAANPESLPLPMRVLFEVDATGAVVDVLGMGGGPRAEQAVREALADYRFAPAPGTASQHGTLVIEAEPDDARRPRQPALLPLEDAPREVDAPIRLDLPLDRVRNSDEDES